MKFRAALFVVALAAVADAVANDNALPPTFVDVEADTASMQLHFAPFKLNPGEFLYSVSPLTIRFVTGRPNVIDQAARDRDRMPHVNASRAQAAAAAALCGATR